MRKVLLSLILMMGATAVNADSYTYLTFELTDGSKASVSVSSVSLNFSGTTLTVGNETYTLTNLSKMYFTTSDQTTTGIESVTTETLNEAAEIFDLNGHKVQKSEMKNGVYIVKTKTGTHKMIVR